MIAPSSFTKSLIIGAVASIAAIGAAGAQDAADPTAAVSGEYASDPTHAYITFSYSHQGYSKPFLRWRKWDATLDWDAENPEKSQVTVDIDAASIDSGVDKFDDHLRSADFFDVENHPRITFKSTELVKTSATEGKLIGELTVKTVTKPVELDVVLNRAAEDGRRKSHKLGFSARGTIKRTDFDVGKYAPFVGDDVDLLIEVEFEKPLAGE